MATESEKGWRDHVLQLADDFRWLEEHARRQQNGDAHAGRLRLAAALVRNCINPFLENPAAPGLPLHVAVVGGAGTGKSTIANFLTGSAVAETNPQAGFTRHPVAYVSANGQLSWSQYLGFLGPLRRLFETRPSNLDEDVYQIRQVPAANGEENLLREFVVWDCPDMTTWHAAGYVSRLIEVAALADVVVFVASDERYNDLVPSQFLQLMLQAGKPVIACLMKMPPGQALAIIDHFRKEVIGPMPEGNRLAACLAVPQLSPQELANLDGKASEYRRPLVEQAAGLARRAEETRHATVQRAADYLEHRQEELLSVAKDDLLALRTWRELVQSGRVEFEGRYFREYLGGEQFPRFNDALVRLLQLLELPGVGQYVSKALWVVRTPWRLAKGLWNLGSPPAKRGMPEEPVLTAALTAWLERVRKEAALRVDAHPLWREVEHALQGKLPDQVRTQFQQHLRDFQAGLAHEVELTARAIYEDLEKNPIALNTLRTGKLTLELGSMAGAIVSFGINVWDVILVPLAASLSQELVELLGKQHVDLEREKARQRQQQLFARTLAIPLAEWLAQWPVREGADIERLQQALRRIPEGIRRVNSAVRSRMGGARP